MSWLARLVGLGQAGGRERGDPTSSNGASSMHLFWELDGEFAGASVDLEVLTAPAVARLYFWALQGGFCTAGRDCGAAHLGLQWHPDHPGSTAVNWGGYAPGGRILDGTDSSLPSALDNVNTRDLSWQAGRRYRLRIERGGEAGWWRGSVTDVDAGDAVVIRELGSGGTHLRRLMTWSEVFARCDDPPVTVRWSNPVAWDDHGTEHRPRSARVNYQALTDGGCSNTTSYLDPVGWCQRTANPRITPQGASLALPPPAPTDRSPA